MAAKVDALVLSCTDFMEILFGDHWSRDTTTFISLFILDILEEFLKTERGMWTCHWFHGENQAYPFSTASWQSFFLLKKKP